jgi:hypothetical protein
MEKKKGREKCKTSMHMHLGYRGIELQPNQHKIR